MCVYKKNTVFVLFKKHIINLSFLNSFSPPQDLVVEIPSSYLDLSLCSLNFKAHRGKESPSVLLKHG